MTTPVFRPGDRPLLHLGLLAATAVTTFTSFYILFGDGLAHRVQGAITFSLCLLFVLGTHEMGHYVLARIHGVDASLPYFIPFPFGVGTLGAVIRIRGPIPDRNALVDIGAAGPLAGLTVALPMLVYGMLHSPPTDTIPPHAGWPSDTSLWSAGQHLIHYLVARAHGQTLPVFQPPTSAIIFGDNLLTFGLKRLVFGALPVGKDIHEHPVYLAAWFGLLVTMLNLIPIGQLDGGHLTHALFGDKARFIGKVMALGMLGLFVFGSSGWLLWLGVTAGIIGFKHPNVVDPERPLSGGRWRICALSAVAFVLCIMPIPLTVIGG